MSVDQDAPAASTTIIFDYGEVLSRPQSSTTKRHMEDISGVGAADFWAAYWSLRRPYDEGQPATEYWRAVAAEVGTEWTPAQLQSLWAADLGGWLDLDPRGVELLDTLTARETPLVLLSNAPRDLAAALRHSPALSGFHTLFFSGELGLAKPDPLIYDHVMRELAIPAEHALFVDDREENILAADRRGIRTHHFTGLDALTQDLATRGLL
ncbi:HAD family phosphatase [Spiractinospora alimapuensis]|nr:HAD family phosphatase [Spiractinospora alimapuensis]QVQ53527.1 HAD family phosphatase [Spiractinospora alimapuensis]